MFDYQVLKLLFFIRENRDLIRGKMFQDKFYSIASVIFAAEKIKVGK